MTLHVPLHPDRVVLARSRTAFALVTLIALLATDVTSLPAQAAGTAKGLAPPNNLWAAQTSAKELTIVWDAVPGATEYRLYSSMSAVASGIGNFAPFARAIQSRGSAIMRMVFDIFRTLPGGESLYIQAVDAAGRLSPMTPFNRVIPVAKSAVPVKVLAPTNVLATETAPGVITLTWDAVQGATAYALGRSVQPNGFRSLCAICPTHTTYVDSGATQAVQHSYSVLALTPNGTSPNARSNIVTPGGGTIASGTGGGTTAPGSGSGTGTGTGTGSIATLPPKGVTNPKAVLITPDSVELTWTPDPKATDYVIERSINGAAFQILSRVAGSLNRFIDALSPFLGGVAYRITASNAKGPSPAVAFNPITLPGLAGAGAALPPKGPTNLKALLLSPDSVELTWTPDPKAAGYTIERSISGRAFHVIAQLAPAIQALIDALPPVVGSVVYRITASNPKGTSPALAFNTLTIVPKGIARPTGVTSPASAVTSASSISLSWVPEPAATSYRIERSLSGGTFQLLVTLPGAVPSYVDAVSGLTKQNPRYRIISVNSSGMSPAVAVP